MKPGTSLRTWTGAFPRDASSAIVLSIVASQVRSAETTSTSGTRKGGFHECVPSARSGRFRPAMIFEIGMTDVLLARIASEGTCPSISSEQPLFQSEILGHGLDHQVGSDNGRLERAARRYPLGERSILTERGQIAANPVVQRLHCGDRRIIDPHVVTAAGEDLGDPVPHKAGPDDPYDLSIDHVPSPSSARRACVRPCCLGRREERPLLDAVGWPRIGDRHQADDAAVAAIPVPREEREGEALAGDLVDVAADILDAENAVLEQDAVHRLPFGESSFQSRPPDHFLYSSARCGCSGPLRCGPIAVASG